ncbi:MAG: Redoxin domain protein [Nocardioides sp.]|nr:Redoxin domain protein [Nocardioides sp.]
MTRSTPRRAAAVLVSALVLVGCGSEPEPAADAPVSSPSSPTSPSSPAAELTTSTAPTGTPAGTSAPVPEALQFEATTVSGETFDGASVAGRPVVLWFWAPWCAVCKSQAPEVSRLVDDFGDDVAFLGVGSLSDAGDIESFAGDVPGPTHLSDPEGELYQRFGIAEQSSFVVLDADGGEVLRTGYADDDELAGTVADLAG